jgi:hypothetical protein
MRATDATTQSETIDVNAQKGSGFGDQQLRVDEVVKHGTRSQYRKGCKCPACKAAEAAYKREQVSRAATKTIPHGTVQGYVYKCRCEACVQAKRAYEASRVPSFGSAAFPHGTSAGSKYGCRCEACKTADRARIMAWKASQDLTAADFPHGAVAGYNRGCSCEACKEAWKNNSDARRANLDKTDPDFPHGTVAGYRDWCRCEACVDAITARTSARHKERMSTDPEYVKAYRGHCRTKVAKRRAATRTVPSNDPIIKQIYLHTPDGYEVDHIVPLSKGGTHEPSNMQYLPSRVNRRKHAKVDYDCSNVALNWQDFISQSPTTISKESRFQAEPKCPTTACAA